MTAGQRRRPPTMDALLALHEQGLARQAEAGRLYAKLNADPAQWSEATRVRFAMLMDLARGDMWAAELGLRLLEHSQQRRRDG